MSDFIEQRVREAFVEFRDDARVEISAPGPEEARRVVRRRRRIGTAIGATGLAGLLVGAWVLLGPPAGLAPVASEPTTPSPTIDHEQSVSAAFERLGYQSYESEWLAIPNSPVWWGTTAVGTPQTRVFQYPGSRPDAPISMAAACAGTGSITLRLQSPDGSADIDVSCGRDGSPEYTALPTVFPDQEMQVTVRGDDQVSSEGAFVVVMTDPRSLAALAALGPVESAEAETTTSTTYDPYLDGTSNRPVGPGRYELTLYCIGDAGGVAGEVLVRMSLAAEEVSEQAACPAEGGQIGLEVSSPTAATLEVSMSERGSFGYAYRITRTETPS
jgi:hypothetical protein